MRGFEKSPLARPLSKPIGKRIPRQDGTSDHEDRCVLSTECRDRRLHNMPGFASRGPHEDPREPASGVKIQLHGWNE